MYDPSDEFDPRRDVNLDPPEPVSRSLDAEGWGVTGEGTPALLDAFVQQLNTGSFDGIPVRIRPEYSDWGSPRLAFARSKQKPRGKALVAKVDMTAESMAYLQGRIGQRQYGVTPNEFMSEVRPDDVEEYAAMFRDGQRPGAFIVEMDTDGDPSGHQEGRHRSLAAIEAGVEWVPVVVIRNTGGTFRRSERRRKPDGPGYWSNYPEAEQ